MVSNTYPSSTYSHFKERGRQRDLGEEEAETATQAGRTEPVNGRGGRD